MLAVWLAATGARIAEPLPHAVWLAVQRGDYVAAAVLVLPVAAPAGLLAGGWAWSRRLRSMAARAGGRSPGAAISFDRRQWRHQVRSAQARIAAPGAVPLLTRSGDFVAGAVIRAVGHPDQPLARLPASRLRSHQIVIGGTGTGKTTLLLRLWAAFMAAGLRLHAAGQAPARRCSWCWTARAVRTHGASLTAVAGCCESQEPGTWPSGPMKPACRIWALPVRQLVTTLVDLIEHGTGGAAYYADVMEAVVALAVEAPAGPPASTADFLARLDPGWLALAWLGDEDRLALARSAARQVPDIALRFRTLFRRLGTGLDGPGGFADADAWYCILEGTAEISVAEAQARALVDLLASYVARTSPSPSTSQHRQVLLAVDEFSAVSRRLPIWQLYERARSLGLAVQVSAQSWHGLAAREDDRYRLAATAEGGIWLLRTPHPDPVVALAGQRCARRQHPAAHRAPALEPDGDVPRRPCAGRRSRPDPRPGRRPDRVSLSRRGDFHPGQAPRRWPGCAGIGACDGDRASESGRGIESGRGDTGRGDRSQGRPAGRVGVPGRGVRRDAVTGPFGVLGLPASADLTDDEVRAAWRRQAAATHPDRADGGDPAAFVAAAAAYTLLRTGPARAEALGEERSRSMGQAVLGQAARCQRALGQATPFPSGCGWRGWPRSSPAGSR